MKESKLIEMQKQIQALIRVVDYMRQELEQVKTMPSPRKIRNSTSEIF